ncbi:hypothetical protein IU449_23345 [Nocardia higoensis]|uniref:Uncharacterized protein n=1 Tax=Nocardia higoensis TaxID=228599 RepID=A0ABS0DG58_9NOCA|nr:hypothetical protein [Nocardia higoensis]MBF6357446.1 hypothetical protein [Nocardia higoensis]
MQTLLTNLSSLWHVVVAALVLGAGLPAVFALGVRWWSAADTVDEGGVAERNHVAMAGAYACFGLIIVAVLTGILYTAKAFLAARLGIHLFGE